jgi:hypothetical protein
MELLQYLWKEGYLFLVLPLYMYFSAKQNGDAKVALSDTDKVLHTKLTRVGGVLLILFFFVGKYLLKLPMFHQ